MRPSVLIVPGAWQLPVAFDALKSDMSATFPEVSVVSLPTVGGTSTPLPSLGDDVAAVRTELDRLVSKGSEVVLYGHSYGGVVASSAVEGYDAKSRSAAGKTGGVISVVYASAFMVPKGMSLLDMLGGVPLPWMIVQEDRVVGNATMLPEIGFNDLSPADAAYWTTQMTYTALGAFVNQSTYEPWSNGIDCRYLFATEDNALPLATQQAMAAQAPGMKSATEPSGHCAHLSRPKNVTEIMAGWFQ
ncbi:hypothetical protein PpBr36_03906 [Pyricularia pennisetigena]|uniref:hypothetical protein n=1 Tax=Pyricularia pennisetigena TaxID=1578925 RepID=UPI00114DC266|nr:hypothetical protein PpBr36_03906 [Pyricularia pennisetigena]TLS31580.1 hypothetical protein PpBr36_03906 [Pyricularia pennisetigena]